MQFRTYRNQFDMKFHHINNATKKEQAQVLPLRRITTPELIHVDPAMQKDVQFWRVANGFSITIQSPTVAFSMTDRHFGLYVFFVLDVCIYFYTYTSSQTLHRPWHLDDLRCIDDWLLLKNRYLETPFNHWKSQSLHPSWNVGRTPSIRWWSLCPTDGFRWRKMGLYRAGSATFLVTGNWEKC